MSVVPPPTVFLHIGTMKSGTTYLQGVLWENRARLREAGLLFPGGEGEQGPAARDVLHGESLTDPALLARTRGAWRRLSAEMLDFPGRSVVSMEFLSFANAERAARVVDSLSGADVHVVLTVRDTARTLPAQWQTMCRTGSTVSWPRFAAAVETATARDRYVGPAARVFRRTQHVPRMLAAWSSRVPSERIHVVTVPPPGSDPLLLWRRFASVLGVDPAVATEPPARANQSLGYASAELMRRVNLRLGPVTQFDYNRTMKKHVGQALEHRARTERRTPMDVTTYALADRWNDVVRTAVVESGAQVVGDLQDLPVTHAEAHAAEAATESPPPREELLEAAAVARDTLVALVDERRLACDETVLPVPLGEPGPISGDPTRPDRWAGDPHPVRAAVDELAGLASEAMRLRRSLEPGSTAG